MSGLLARLRSWFETLAPRERALVAAVGVVAVLGLLFVGVVRPLHGAADAAEARAEAAARELEALQQLRARYDEANTRVSRVESRIRSGPQGEIFTALETMARESAVQVDSMEPRTTPASEDYRETKVQVALKGVTLAQTVNYLHRIESAPQLLSVKSLRMRSRRDDPELLDVTFTVSSFEPRTS
ncbi:MAG: type II secretion system protein GspM [Myxococcota bacterium]|nr:type II secretion system protein GspM [Myxococcota bacterium]